jgi:hypothetical protein
MIYKAKQCNRDAVITFEKKNGRWDTSPTGGEYNEYIDFAMRCVEKYGGYRIPRYSTEYNATAILRFDRDNDPGFERLMTEQEYNAMSNLQRSDEDWG